MKIIDKVIDTFIDRIIEKEKIGEYTEYFIVMADYDTFILKVKDTDRPNNANDDETIAEYMHNNYYGHSYEIIDKDNGRYEVAEV